MLDIFDVNETDQFLVIDITHKQREQLKQAMNRLKKLDYRGTPRNVKSDFEKSFLDLLKTTHDTIEMKRKNKTLIDMQAIHSDIIYAIDNHIAYVTEVKKIDNDFKSYNPKKQKQKTTAHNLEKKQSF